MNSNHPAASDSHRVAYRVVLSLILAWVLLGLVTIGLSVPRAAAVPEDARVSSPAFLERFNDPVVLTGAQLSAFSDVPLNELVAYASQGGTWTPIPFQIDEVNISGTYVVSDGGRLDANDELVFMAGDAGESVSAADWPPDASARLSPRVAITVTDPLSAGQQAWVYVYRSTTLTRSHVSYITWTHATQTAAAISYTAAFSPTKFVGLSDLFINGGSTDILDRQKTRLATFITLSEENIVALLGSATLTLPITGPVRAVTNNGDLQAAFYGSRLDFDVVFNLGSIPFTINSIRTSFDWISPTLSGINTYYDSNTPGGVAIDGMTDAISAMPHVDWFQVNGGVSGPGGLVMVIPQVDPAGGVVANYYKDNGAIDNNDTGDRRSYGDAGLMITQPGKVVSFTLSAYILPPGGNTNAGAVYFARASYPLQATTAQQCDTPTGVCAEPLVPPERVAAAGPVVGAINALYTFIWTVTPISVTTPITYVYQATDQAGIIHTRGSTDSVTFLWNTIGPKIISVTASNGAGLVTTTHAIEILLKVPPSSVDAAGPVFGAIDKPYTFTLTVAPASVTTPITYTYQTTDQAGIIHTSGSTDSVTFLWNTIGPKIISVTASNGAGLVTTAHGIEIFVPPARAVVTGTTSARASYPHTYVASVNPLTTTLPITYIWQATDNSLMTATGGLSNSATLAWMTAGFKAISVTAYNNGGMVSTDPLWVWVEKIMFLPLVLKNAP